MELDMVADINIDINIGSNSGRELVNWAKTCYQNRK